MNVQWISTKIDPEIVRDMLDGQVQTNIEILCEIFRDHVQRSTRDSIVSADKLTIDDVRGDLCIRGIDGSPFVIVLPRNAQCKFVDEENETCGIKYSYTSFGMQYNGFVPMNAGLAGIVCQIFKTYVLLIRKDNTFAAFLSSLNMRQVNWPFNPIAAAHAE